MLLIKTNLSRASGETSGLVLCFECVYALLVGGTDTSTENLLAFILFRASSLLLGEGKEQEEEGMWPDELSGFACLSHSSFGNFMVRNYGPGSPTEKRSGSG